MNRTRFRAPTDKLQSWAFRNLSGREARRWEGQIAEAFDIVGHVAPIRLRGEIARVTHLASGHFYLTLKAEKAAIEGAQRSGRPSQQSEIR